MVARYTGAGLGLLAFAVTTVSGLLVRNPVDVTLSRSIFALFLFCAIGLVLGSIAKRIVAEYEQQRREEISEAHREKTRSPSTDGVAEEVT